MAQDRLLSAVGVPMKVYLNHVSSSLDADKRPIFLVSNVFARPRGAATSHRWTTMGGNAEVEVAMIAEIASAAAAVRGE